MTGSSEEAVARHVLRRPELAGLRGPTIARVHEAAGQPWYAVTVVVPAERLLPVVDHLRQMGGSGISVFQPRYLFESRCESAERLEGLSAESNGSHRDR